MGGDPELNPAKGVPNWKQARLRPAGSSSVTKSCVIVQLFVPSVGVNGVNAGEESAVRKVEAVSEKVKLSTGPLRAV
jgi:hypothetical protein